MRREGLRESRFEQRCSRCDSVYCLCRIVVCLKCGAGETKAPTSKVMRCPCGGQMIPNPRIG